LLALWLIGTPATITLPTEPDSTVIKVRVPTPLTVTWNNPEFTPSLILTYSPTE
jgi:hypothetical protein